jgi:hypothetical protein
VTSWVCGPKKEELLFVSEKVCVRIPFVESLCCNLELVD